MDLILTGERGGLYASLAAAGHRKSGTITSLVDNKRRGLIRLRDGSLATVDAITNRNIAGEEMVLSLSLLLPAQPLA